MNKDLFNDLYRQFSVTLPDKSTFFNTNIVGFTRYHLSQYYNDNGSTDLRRYLWFCKEYGKEVDAYIASVAEENKAKEAAQAIKPSE